MAVLDVSGIIGFKGKPKNIGVEDSGKASKQ
jgi:hypothetical protein